MRKPKTLPSKIIDIDKLSPKEQAKLAKITSFFDEFKAFINRGNVVDLAIGVIIGGAFGKIVTSLVQDIITPLLGVLMGGINFSSLSITIPNIFGAPTSARIAYGSFIQNIIDFSITAFAIFFFIHITSKIRNAKSSNNEKTTEEKPPTETELEVLQDIRNHLKNSSKSTKLPKKS